MSTRFNIKSLLASNTNVDPDDSIKTKEALRRLGYYNTPSYGMTPYPDRELFTAVADLQRDSGIPPTGEMRPGDDTEKAVRAALDAPSSDEKKGKYIWRTRGDSKVRSEHADRDGKVFDWDNPPEGGHPGEAPNCRCTAEDVKDNKEKCQRLANEIENMKLQIHDDIGFVDRARANLHKAHEEYIDKENDFWLQIITAGIEELLDVEVLSFEMLQKALKIIGRLDLLRTLSDALHEKNWAASNVDRSQETLTFLENQLAKSRRRLTELSAQLKRECNDH